MKYQALFVIFEKKWQNLQLSSAANVGGALWVKILLTMLQLTQLPMANRKITVYLLLVSSAGPGLQINVRN